MNELVGFVGRFLAASLQLETIAAILVVVFVGRTSPRFYVALGIAVAALIGVRYAVAALNEGAGLGPSRLLLLETILAVVVWSLVGRAIRRWWRHSLRRSD